MIRGNVAVVRHGATAPSTQSGAVLLELSPSRMRDSGWDQLPPDVRFAGEALQKMRAPPWIAIYLNQPLTEKPSCEAGHMTAPDQCCKNVRKFLPRRRRPHMPRRRARATVPPWLPGNSSRVSSLLACYALGPPASAAQYSCHHEACSARSAWLPLGRVCPSV